MVWSVNPGLTSYRVREIIINSADPGEIITDPITLEFRNSFQADGEVVYSYFSNNGRYVAQLPAGNYNVTAVGDEYVTTRGQVISLFGVSAQNIYLTPLNPAPTLPMLSNVSTWVSPNNRLITASWDPFPGVIEYHIYYRQLVGTPPALSGFRYFESTSDTSISFRQIAFPREIRIEATTATSRIVFGNRIHPAWHPQ